MNKFILKIKIFIFKYLKYLKNKKSYFIKWDESTKNKNIKKK